jgi:hypothetical protein
MRRNQALAAVLVIFCPYLGSKKRHLSGVCVIKTMSPSGAPSLMRASSENPIFVTSFSARVWLLEIGPIILSTLQTL